MATPLPQGPDRIRLESRLAAWLEQHDADHKALVHRAYRDFHHRLDTYRKEALGLGT